MTRLPPVVDMSPFYFQGKNHVMSNMYPCKIQTGNKTFHGTEQAYHYRCACDLGDWKAQNTIENSRDGVEAKRGGKLISKELMEPDKCNTSDERPQRCKV